MIGFSKSRSKRISVMMSC